MDNVWWLSAVDTCNDACSILECCTEYVRTSHGIFRRIKTYYAIKLSCLGWRKKILPEYRFARTVHVHYFYWVKVKQSHYKPGQALWVPEVWNSQISRQSAHEGGKVVRPTQRPPLPPRKYSWYSFLLEAQSTPRPCCDRKDYVNDKIPATPSRTEAASFQLVAQCLNQTRHRAASRAVHTFCYSAKSIFYFAISLL